MMYRNLKYKMIQKQGSNSIWAVRCLAPEPIKLQWSNFYCFPSTFLRCASDKTIVRAVAYQILELQLLKVDFYNNNQKVIFALVTRHSSTLRLVQITDCPRHSN